MTIPIITCTPSGMIGDTPQWSFWCRFCKTYHRHGGKPDANGEIGHRTAHCHAESPYHATGYMLTTKDLFWEQKAEGEWSAARVDPIAFYTVREVNRGRHPRYHVDVLTEVGRAAIGREFRTLQAAKRFCDRNFQDWRLDISKISKMSGDISQP